MHGARAGIFLRSLAPVVLCRPSHTYPCLPPSISFSRVGALDAPGPLFTHTSHPASFV